jgi:hypothetical protein
MGKSPDVSIELKKCERYNQFDYPLVEKCQMPVSLLESLLFDVDEVTEKLFELNNHVYVHEHLQSSCHSISDLCQ